MLGKIVANFEVFGALGTSVSGGVMLGFDMRTSIATTTEIRLTGPTQPVAGMNFFYI